MAGVGWRPAVAQVGKTFDLVIIGGRVIDPPTRRDEIANVAERRIAAALDAEVRQGGLGYGLGIE